ncbi:MULTISPECIES: hypothetical protein [Sphingobacterium]|uniref:hypothetical protein n=1 Tax=Sphingobacterium TaxID=28453 RepID=UPI0028B06062|nr:hypothetical protein [Sphingobacterium multivorum]
MAEPLQITIELLNYLQAAGYQSLLLKFGDQVYIPRKEKANELMEIISTVPFKEDDILSVSDAINMFYELDLETQYISNIFD